MTKKEFQKKEEDDDRYLRLGAITSIVAFIMLCVMVTSLYNKCTAQDKAPHKNDAFIHIVTWDARDATITKFGKFLYDNGYPLRQSGDEYRSLVTDWVSLEVTIAGNDIKVGIYASYYARADAQESPILIQYKRKGEYSNKEVWNTILKTLYTYPHSRIYYSQT